MTDHYDIDSERLFAELCQRKGYVCERIQTDPRRKTPDFRVSADNLEIYVEVKQFDKNADFYKTQADLEKEGSYIGTVDFNHDGGLTRKLHKQASQLRDFAFRGFVTLGVLYSNRLFGPTDYQVENALSTACIPKEISALLRIRNENLSGFTPEYQLYKNPSATAPFPDNIFTEKDK